VADYFPRGEITGIDIALRAHLSGEARIATFEGSQTNTAFLDHVGKTVAPNGFDIIIDDASHIGEYTKTSFDHLFANHLKSSGLYVIEDWGTGYWDDWPDGRCYRPRTQTAALLLRILHRLRLIRQIPLHTHRYGLVGLIKELIDEQGVADLMRRSVHGSPGRASHFASVTITPSIVFVTKAAK
jgi:hypothetical protein